MLRDALVNTRYRGRRMMRPHFFGFGLFGGRLILLVVVVAIVLVIMLLNRRRDR